MNPSDVAVTLVAVSLAVVIAATIWLFRQRAAAREAAREAEKINVLSNDTRRSFWYSGSDVSGQSGGPSDGGSDGGSD